MIYYPSLSCQAILAAFHGKCICKYCLLKSFHEIKNKRSTDEMISGTCLKSEQIFFFFFQKVVVQCYMKCARV